MAAPSKDFVRITDSEIDPDSPETTGLVTRIRDALEHLEEWLGKNFVAAVDHDHDGVNSKKIDAGYVLLEHIELSSPATAITFSGLNGTLDGHYALRFNARAVSSPSSGAISIKANATFPATSRNVVQDSARTVNTGVGSIFPGIVNASVAGVINIQAMETAGSVSSLLRMYEYSVYSNVGGGTLQHGGGNWASTLANITSLSLNAVNTNGFAAGSYFSLYKVTIV